MLVLYKMCVPFLVSRIIFLSTWNHDFTYQKWVAYIKLFMQCWCL
jgi:hypothetical protein